MTALTYDRDRSGELLARIARSMVSVNRLGVAFSGGVDSSVLLAAAVRTLGPSRVVAVLGVSPSLAVAERTEAHEVAAFIGAPVVEVFTKEGDRAAYRANGPDRCFHCKDELFSRISDEVVLAHGLTAVAYGENADDASRIDRPGSRAATNHRVLRPLADAGLRKSDVRDLARAWGLPCADKPAAPCLASRIPHHQEVTPEKLGQIDRAESALHELGFADVRVRHHGDVARIELPLPDLVRACTEPTRERVRRAVIDAGFRYATVDLAGMQSGAFTLTVLQTNEAPAGGHGGSSPPEHWRLVPEGHGLEDVANLDLDRTRRRGYPEAVYCAEKTADQVALIAAAVGSRPDVTTLFTRATAEHASAVLQQLPDAVHYAEARLLAWPPEPPPATGGLVAVLAAGTSDLQVATEAYLTARYLGRPSELVVDVGVAGLHRVLGRLELLREAKAVVVAAGMDGALPSVVAGLTGTPVIGLPTSVGYGASFGGIAALLAMLNACAPGVGVVNIDNGYGAGHLAAQIAAPGEPEAGAA